jgi:hypothetical protein
MLQSVDLAVQLVLRLSMSPMRSAYAQQRRSLSQLARRWVAATLMMPRSLSVVVPDRHEAMRACVMRVTAVCLADHPATQIAPVAELVVLVLRQSLNLRRSQTRTRKTMA